MASISLKYKSKSGNLTAPGDVDLGAMIPIATTVVGSGGSSTITFSSIPNTYEHLQIRAIARSAGGSSEDEYRIRLNGDTGNNYSWHYLLGNGSAASASASTTTERIIVRQMPTTVQSAGFGVLIIDILDYSNTNKYKTLRALGGYDVNGSGTVSLNSGLWQNTTAVSTITIANERTVNFLEYSHFALYGIKRAGA